MSKISLRAYNREIENLIDQGNSEEAIAHCKYILKFFPKHADTYRLLGKAFLECQQYGEAADVFQRLVAVIPDDFIAQISMSIIREDEGNLDASIFHMERAFEVKPANAAVQDELKRLYGRRDGMEPPRVRLTRGALIRMYLRGELYQQAISEARAALAEDPQRIDLEVLLARIYDLSGQKTEAVEMCSRLVSKLPYCMEANRILAKILPFTPRAQDAQIYQQRMAALDPYTSYISDQNPNSVDVPEVSVQLEYLDYSPTHQNSQPHWAGALGADLEVQNEEQPQADWLSAIPAELQTSQQQLSSIQEVTPPAETLQPFNSQEELSSLDLSTFTPDQPMGIPSVQPQNQYTPDWMQSSGWSDSGGEKSPTIESEASPELAQGEIPDWLKDFAPIQTSEELSETPLGDNHLKMLDQTLPTSVVQPSLSESHPLSEETSHLTEEPRIVENLPDWLKDLAPERDVQSSAVSEPEQPIWLKNEATTQTAATAADALPAWLEELKPTEDAEEPTEKMPEDLPTPPAWIYGEPQGFVEKSSDLPSQALNPDQISPAAADIPDWLKVMQADGAYEQLTDITQLDIVEIPQVEDTEHTPIEYGKANQPENVIPASTDMGDAMAWLETLAARQGADQETLLTKPEERQDAPLAWVTDQIGTESTKEIPPETGEHEVIPTFSSEEGAQGISAIAEEIPPEQALASELQSDEENPWVSSETHYPDLSPISEEIPEWLKEEPETSAVITDQLGKESAQEISSTTAGQQPLAPQDLDGSFAWLEALAAEQGAQEDLALTPEERTEAIPEWIKEQSETESNKASIPAEASQSLETPVAGEIAEPVKDEPIDIIGSNQPVVPEEELPLQSVPPVSRQVEDLPDWLKAMELEPEPIRSGEDLPFWLKAATPVEEAPESAPISGLPPESWINVPQETPFETEPDLDLAAQNAMQVEQTPPSEINQGDASLENVPPQTMRPTPAILGEEESGLVATTSQEEDIHPAPLQPSLPTTDKLPKLDEVPSAPLQETEMVAGQSDSEETKPSPEAVPEDQHLPILDNARAALANGDINQATILLADAIENEENLEELIKVIKGALFRHPVEVGLWQNLGDALSVSGDFQEALDAYTKAEELLR